MLIAGQDRRLDLARAGGRQVSYVKEQLDWRDTAGENYILRHWRGHLSLPISYWVNGLVIPFAITFGLTAGITQLATTELSLQWLMVGSLAVLALGALVWIWSIVGIWHSAGYHVERGGGAGWANFARFMVVMAALGAVGQSHNRFLYALEAGQLAFGQDPIGEPAKLTLQPDRKTAVLDGNITAGTAKRFGDFIGEHPEVKSVSLRSLGGRMLEADRMAKLINRRRLNTEAQEYCMSACTVVLLAGKERSATSRARIGFHQPQFPGITPDDQAAIVADMRAMYLKAGVDGDFLDKVVRVAPDNMWFPTVDELLDAKVITTSPIVVRGRSKMEVAMRDQQLQRYLDYQAAQINASGPKRIDHMTTRTGAKATPHVLTIRFKTEFSRGQVDPSVGRREMRPVLSKQICDDRKTSLAVDAGATFVFTYFDRSGGEIFSVPISQCSSSTEGVD